jgi:hypothetical protein
LHAFSFQICQSDGVTFFRALHDSVLFQLIGARRGNNSNVINMPQLLPRRISDGKLVLLALAGMMAALAILLVFVSSGAVRHVAIFLPEKTEDTIAFRNIDGEVQVVGIKGVAGVNPTLLTRTGDYVLELTVINDDDSVHVLYIDGGVHTKVLRPGESDMITFNSKGEGTYNYYDWGSGRGPLGQIQAIKVTMFE